MIYLAGLMGSAALQAVPLAEGTAPRIGPQPAWVVPVEPPAVQVAATPSPVTLVLQDQQVAFERGRKIVFFRNMFRINTPEGLAAGNLALAWDPATDVLTVHRVVIHRGDRRIDVLAGGQGFTVLRREPNLQQAMLDGVLTATMQPVGLEVGDVLEVAGSIASNDPVLGAHVEQMIAPSNDLPVMRGHIRLQWPAALPLRMRATDGLELPAPVVRGATRIVDLTRDALTPIIPPANAPARYSQGRLVETTDFASWADLAAALAPLYDVAGAPTAGSPIDGEIVRIRALSNDPLVRAQAALSLVQDKVRYVALMMNGGGLRPATVAETWSRRFADCKGKTLLLLTLLHALEIDAVPVVVSSGVGDGLDQRLPLVGLFDHVLVRATIAGKTYWLDGTRNGDTDLERLTVPYYSWGLPLIANGATLVRMIPAPLTVPNRDTSIAIDVSAGLKQPAAFTVRTILRGDDGIVTNLSLASLDTASRERMLRDYWRRQYGSVQASAVDSAFDRNRGELTLSMRGTMTTDWTKSYEVDGMRLGYNADFTRDPGIDRDAPFVVSYPVYNRTVETITYPPYHQLFDGMLEADRTIAGVEYKRSVSRKKNTLRYEASMRSVRPEFPAKDAAKAQADLRELADFNTVASVGRFRESEAGKRADIAAVLKTDPKDQDALDKLAYIQSSNGDIDGALSTLARIPTPTIWQDEQVATLLTRKRDYAGALARLDRSIERLPDEPHLGSFRATVLNRAGRKAEAIRELQRIETMKDGRFIAAAAYYDALKMPAEAVRQYDRAVEQGGDLARYYYFNRANARPESDAAGRMSDLNDALKIDQDYSAVIVAKAELLARLGKRDAAGALLNAALARHPTDIDLLIGRAEWFLKADERDGALQDLVSARASATDFYAFWALCNHDATAKIDLTLALADCDAAAVYEPGPVASDRARILVALARYPEAISAYDRALRYNPDRPDVIRERAGARRKIGDEAGYQADMSEAQRLAKELGVQDGG